MAEAKKKVTKQKRTKKPQTSKPTAKQKKNTKEDTPAYAKATADRPVKVFDFYNDIFSYREIPVTQSKLERLCKEWIKWAIDTPDAYKPRTFILNQGIPWKTIMRWTEKHDIVATTHETIKQIIGDRREHGAITKELSEKLVMHSMPMYDPEWKEREKEVADLKKDDEKTDRPVNIYMDRIHIEEPNDDASA